MVFRNKKLLEILRNFPCQHCGKQDGTVVAAHSNQLRDGKGKGIKASDYRVASLCFMCHAELDQGKNLSKQQRIELWEEAHRKTIGLLFDNGYIEVR